MSDYCSPAPPLSVTCILTNFTRCHHHSEAREGSRKMAAKMLELGLGLGLGFERNRRTLQSSISGAAISCVFVFITQFSLLLVPKYFPSWPLPAQLFLSGIVLVSVTGVGKLCKRILRVRASAPAFIFFTILFIWAVYLVVVRPAISTLKDILLNGELAVLVIGLFRILLSDPGFVERGSSDSDRLVVNPVSQLERRVRFCKTCNVLVRGFDHHCPAFGNCIGQKNQVLFIVLLGGFIATEISYLACAHQVTWKFQSFAVTGLQINLKGSFAISTVLFSLIQLLWQVDVVFLAWHLYCVCFNIKTDEWINWKRYPEFQVICHQPQTGEPFTEMKFKNPYDKGIICNIVEFLSTRH
ncbi:hypothetical protein Dimus_009120 [Dionaea muscipula]